MARVVLAFLVSVLVVSASPVPAQTTRPNILLIVADDVALNDYKVLIERGLLPHIQSLIETGVEFTDAFESGSVGSSSRISLLTGQYPHNHGEKGADLFFGGPPRHNEATLLPNWLKAAGYLTGIIGRTIPGYGAGDLTPQELEQIGRPIGGLPLNFYSAFPPATHVPPGWDLWQVFVEPYTWSVSDYKISFNGTKVDFGPFNHPIEQLHQSDAVAWLGGIFIRAVANYGRPWFLQLAPVTFNRELWPGPSIYNVCPDSGNPLAWWFGGPYYGVSQRPPLRHLDTIWNANDPAGVAAAEAEYPFPTPPSFNEADVTDKPRWVQLIPSMSPSQIDCTRKRWWRRLELLKALDDLVGFTMTALSETGQLERTYVILTSDNGMGDGQHRYDEKLSAYEEAIRVPLIVRRPGTPTASKIGKPVLGIDIAPTIASIAGATPNISVDGRSLLPLMDDPEIPWRKMGLLQHTLGVWDSENTVSPREYWALRIGGDNPRLVVDYPTVQSGYNREYYSLGTDPHQLINLITDPSRRTEFEAILPWLDAMKTCKGAGCRLLEDSFDR